MTRETNDIDLRDRPSWLRKLSLPEATPPPWRLATPAFLVALMLLCLVLVGPALASILLNSQIATPQLLTLSWTIGLGATAAFAFINRRGSQQSRDALRFTKGAYPLPLVALLGVAIALGIDLLTNLPSGRFLPVAQIYGIGASDVFIAAILLVVAQPLAETLVFHATLLPSLRWTLGPRVGILLASLIYAPLHLLVFHAPYQEIYSTGWHGLLHPFLICLTFSALRVASNSSRSVLIARVAAGIVFLLTGLALTL